MRSFKCRRASEQVVRTRSPVERRERRTAGARLDAIAFSCFLLRNLGIATMRQPLREKKRRNVTGEVFTSSACSFQNGSIHYMIKCMLTTSSSSVLLGALNNSFRWKMKCREDWRGDLLANGTQNSYCQRSRKRVHECPRDFQEGPIWQSAESREPSGEARRRRLSCPARTFPAAFAKYDQNSISFAANGMFCRLFPRFFNFERVHFRY